MDRVLRVICILIVSGTAATGLSNAWGEPSIPRLPAVLPPLESSEHASRTIAVPVELPVPDAAFFEHVRVAVPEADWPEIPLKPPRLGVDGPVTTDRVNHAGRQWLGTRQGLYSIGADERVYTRHGSYGVDGPPSNRITGLAVDGRDTLWVATPAGLASRTAEGTWRILRGRDGLPWEALTSVAVVEGVDVWIGSTRGAILYRPYSEGRQWYYRSGQRYLPDDRVVDVRVGDAPDMVFVQTAEGWSGIRALPRTLAGKAQTLLARYEARHRRLGMPSPAVFEDAFAQDNYINVPQASDGMWTSYFVTAMSLAYTLTGEERYRALAKEAMEALYRLQNVTGIEGLVARTVAHTDEPVAPDLIKRDNWHEAPDGEHIWRDDVSSDQIAGHYFAFYSYYEHIAKDRPEERAALEKQVRQVTDYIVDNNYRIIDWDGERTLWGWWNPEMVNDDPDHYLEAGLYSMLMLSHLKVAHYITGDAKYASHFWELIQDREYLSNMLLEKKVWPDELNHSDDQMAALGFYPWILCETDPRIREALHRTIKRHAFIEAPERNSLFAFLYAALAPGDADVAGGVRTLREMPLDRRDWRIENSHRADVAIQKRTNVRDRVLLRDVLPADERHFERWNADPYQADAGGDGRTEGSGEHWLLAYWMGRYHGSIGREQQ